MLTILREENPRRSGVNQTWEVPIFDRADRICSCHGNLKTRMITELLIDCEEDRTLGAVLVGMLREEER